jgi:hypothetical protein
MKEDAIMKALEHMIPFEEVSTLGGDMLISDEAEKEGEELKKGDATPEASEIDESADDDAPTPVPVDNQEPFKV